MNSEKLVKELYSNNPNGVKGDKRARAKKKKIWGDENTEPQNKKGKKNIEDDDDTVIGREYKCTKCKTVSKLYTYSDKNGRSGGHHHKFCFHCGELLSEVISRGRNRGMSMHEVMIKLSGIEYLNYTLESINRPKAK